MERKQSEPIGNLIQQFLRINGLETPYNEHRIVEAWPAVMGTIISQYTKEVFVKNRVLHVKVTSPAIKQNLMMERKNLVQRLNQYVDAQVIEDIHFY